MRFVCARHRPSWGYSGSSVASVSDGPNVLGRLLAGHDAQWSGNEYCSGSEERLYFNLALVVWAGPQPEPAAAPASAAAATSAGASASRVPAAAAEDDDSEEVPAGEPAAPSLPRGWVCAKPGKGPKPA